MEFSVAVHRIWRRRRWLVPVGLIAAFIALNIAYHVSLVPPRLESRSVERGAASTHLLVDSARSALPDLAIPVESLAGRAQVYAELLRTESVRRRIGETAGIPWTSLLVDGSTTGPDVVEPEPSAEERGVELQGDGRDARLFFRVDPSQPIIHITTRGETARQAVVLAQAAALSLSEYLDVSQEQDGVPVPRRVEVTQLGEPDGGTANEPAAGTTALAVGIATFAIGCLLILFIPRFAQSLRNAQALESIDRPPSQRPRRRRWQETVSPAVGSVSSFLKRLQPGPTDVGEGPASKQQALARGNGDLELSVRGPVQGPVRGPERGGAEQSKMAGQSSGKPATKRAASKKPATSKLASQSSGEPATNKAASKKPATQRKPPQQVSAGRQGDSRDD